MPKITYRNGELCRRLSRFEEALDWFSKVTTKNSHLAQLCDRQMVRAMERDSSPADTSDLFCQTQEVQPAAAQGAFSDGAHGEPDQNSWNMPDSPHQQNRICVECASFEEAKQIALAYPGKPIIKNPDGPGFLVLGVSPFDIVDFDYPEDDDENLEADGNDPYDEYEADPDEVDCSEYFSKEFWDEYRGAFEDTGWDGFEQGDMEYRCYEED